MIDMIKNGVSSMKENPSIKESGFNWEDWYKRVEQLYQEAIDNTDDELFRYNIGTKVSETAMLLEMKHLKKPTTYTIIFPEEE